MDAEMSSKLKALLDDPEALGKLISAVSALSSRDREASQADAVPPYESASAPPREAPTLPALSSRATEGLFTASSGGDKRLALLLALKPFLSSERQKKLDSVTKAFSVASVMKNAKNL